MVKAIYASGIALSVVLLMSGCTDISVNGNGPQDPPDVAGLAVDGNAFSLSADGSTIVTWLNVSLDRDPRWHEGGTDVVDASAMIRKKKISPEWNSVNGISGAACNATGDTVWYVEDRVVYRSTLIGSQVEPIGIVEEEAHGICYDPARNAIYVFTGSGNTTMIEKIDAMELDFQSTVATFEHSYWPWYGAKKLRMAIPDLLFTPNGVAVDVVSGEPLWSTYNTIAVLSRTHIVMVEGRTTFLLDLTKEEPQGSLPPQQPIYNSSGAVASSDSQRFAVIYNTSSSFDTDSAYVAVFDASNGEELYQLYPSRHGFGDRNETITDVEFGPGGHTTLYTINRSGDLCRWRIP